MAAQTRAQLDEVQRQLVVDDARYAEEPAAASGAIEVGPAPLLTANEVANMLRVPRSTVYELARNRRIPFLKVGRRTLFARDSLLEWIAAQTVQPRR